MKPTTSPIRPGSIAAAPSIEEFLAGLHWPRLLRAAPLALRASRLGMGVLTLVLVGVISNLSLIWSDQSLYGAVVESFAAPVNTVWGGLWPWDSHAVNRGIRSLVFEAPMDLVEFHTLKLLLTGIPALFVLAVGLGTISRSAACEFSQGLRIRSAECLGFAFARAKSLVGAVIATPLLAAAFAVGISIVSWLLLSVPYLNVIGAAVYPVGLILSAACVILLVGYLFAGPLLIPAVSCEGTDAVDAIQRSYAYALGRPGRLVLYMVLLIAQGVVALAIGSWLVDRVIGFAAWSAGVLLTPESAAVLDGAIGPGQKGHVASWLIEFWARCLRLLIGAYALSFFASAGTVLYLVMRRLCDGQDLEELWNHGMIPGTMASLEVVAADADNDVD